MLDGAMYHPSHSYKSSLVGVRQITILISKPNDFTGISDELVSGELKG